MSKENLTWEEIQKLRNEFLNELAAHIAGRICDLRDNKDFICSRVLQHDIETVDKLVIKFQIVKDGYYTHNKDVFRWFSHIKPEIEKAILNRTL